MKTPEETHHLEDLGVFSWQDHFKINIDLEEGTWSVDSPDSE
jgi:hypothetical protein